MSGKRAVWIIVGLAGTLAVITIVWQMHRFTKRSTTIQGAVIRRDEDTRKELPIADAQVTASDGVSSVSTRTDASGYFSLQFPGRVWPGQIVDLSFQHPDYESLDMKLQIGFRSASKRLDVAAMKPTTHETLETHGSTLSVVSNIKVRYTINSEIDENIGSAVKTFQIINTANVPCKHQPPCSPDGNWKASTGTVSLDAESGNQFRNVRASCIAGPCPFTRIDASGFVNGGRTISVSALDWSDTATFLLEAEVFHSTVISSVRELYPVIFGRVLNFTLPPTQEGVSIEADVDGVAMVFPLGPDLYLSWATCSARTNKDEGEPSTVYRCELKSGYKF